MAHFNRIRPMGTWVTGDTLYASEVEVIDTNLAKAVNGDEGGTWTPTSQIVIGGTGLKITGQFWSTGGFKVDGAAVFNGTATFNNNVTVTGTTTLAGLDVDFFHVNGDAQFDNNVDVDGAVDINGTLAVAGATSLQQVQATTVLAADLSVASNAFFMGATNGGLNKPIVSSTVGRVVKRVSVIGTPGNKVLGITNADVIRIPNSVLTANAVYTINNTEAREGDTMQIVSDDATYNVVIQDGVSLDTLAQIKVLAGAPFSAEILFSSNRWHLLSVGRN